ncbi:MAG: glycosyltransferase [Candidatus Marinimicrobia bacterium]|nr:glycosyltransferase [Candidatus Neomarinimicrobiota bacterium]
MRHDFLTKYQHVPVIEYDNTVAGQAIVSVCVQTYQQSETIRKCLDSILEQNTSFTFEILLAEDQSIDGTRDICLSYAKKYPNKIRLFLHSRENNIEIDGRPSGRFNYVYNLLNARGKYIAFCEGDDYWNDPQKLNKQVEFLENASDYALVHTDNIILNVNNNTRTISRKSDKYISDEIFRQLLNKNHISTVTVLVRRDIVLEACEALYKSFGVEMIMDYSLWLYVSKNAKIKHMPDITATYCLSINSASRPDNKDQQYQYIKKVFDIKIHYCSLSDCNDKFIKRLELNYLRKKLYYAFLNMDTETAKKSIQKIKQINGYLSLRDRMKYLGSKYKILNNLLNKMD